MEKIFIKFFVYCALIYFPEISLIFSESILSYDIKNIEYIEKIYLFLEKFDGLQGFLFMVAFSITMIKIYNNLESKDCQANKELSEKAITLKKKADYNKKRNQEILDSREKNIKF